MLYYLQGTLYPSGGVISQGILGLLLLISIYYFVLTNLQSKLNTYFKALNVLLAMFTVYGAFYIFFGNTIYIGHILSQPVKKYYYLKNIFMSFLPLYFFYTATKSGWLTLNRIKTYLFLFFLTYLALYYRTEIERVALVDREEITNNISYEFLSLIPMLFIVDMKRLWRYGMLALCFIIVVAGMKRGAILIGVLVVLWFFIFELKAARPSQKIFTFLLLIVAMTGILLFALNLYDNSPFFQLRVQQTIEGDTSGRNYIYANFWKYFINQTNSLHLFFGNGADSTITISGGYAHNDWLEIGINNGIFGVVLYFLYWVAFAREWWKTKNTEIIFYCLGSLLIIYFLASLFSMSYNSVKITAALCFGYCWAKSSMWKDMSKIGV